MKMKTFSIPIGMVFKKYYCHNCETRLIKEKNKRIVTKHDKDYYSYHEIGEFPLHKYEVNDYHFKCPKCMNRKSVTEQYIIEKIQKKLKSKRLSSLDIKENYVEAKKKESKRVLIRDILVPLIMTTIGFLLIYIFALEKDKTTTLFVLGFYLLVSGLIVWMTISAHRGIRMHKYHDSYSYEEKSLYEKLHAYSYNNKELIERSNKCYCFHCKQTFASKAIKEYIDDNKTALCPNCQIDSVIPDSIEETITPEIIDGMNKYWF